MRVLSTPAIVLRALDFGESDRIVTLLTRDAGKLAGIAKGAKRSQRRFAGALGLFAHVTLEYRLRPGAELVFLERSTVVRPWKSILDSLERYAAASHVVELADKLTVEHETGDDLFHVVLAALARLDAAEPAAATLRLVELAALSACGYRVELARCVACRRPLEEEPGPVCVVTAAGGAVCGRCAAPEAATPILAPGARAALARMQGAIDDLRSRRALDAPGLLAAEAGAGFDRRAAQEGAVALAALLAPRLRGRLRVLDLLGPILHRNAAGP